MAATIVAVAAMSVVATAACASTVGCVANSSSAAMAAFLPYNLRVQANTIAHASRKKGMLPARALASVFRYSPLP
jgi:hypothetical protein